MQMDSREKAQFKKMTETPVKKLIATLAIPTIISMLITTIYNMADTYFVSHLGTEQSGAVGIVFSMMAITQAFGFAIGVGSGSWISRLLGERKQDKADQVASGGVALGILLGVLFAVFGNIFIKPLMRLLGATEEILPHAIDYARYILLACPVSITSFVLNNILRSEGKATYALVGISIGGILNCFLDPLFIYTFDLGTTGAALASATGQAISFLVLLTAFLRRTTVVNLKIRSIPRDIKVYLTIFKNGMPSMARQGLSSVSSVCLNWSAGLVGGSAAIAAMSIVTKITMFMFSVMIGIGHGYQPVVGYNYSARLHKRVREAFSFMLTASICVCLLMSAFVFVFSEEFMTMFIGNDLKVVEIGRNALCAQCLAMPFIPVNSLCNMTFQAIGKPFIGTLTSSLRQGLLFVPLILVLPQVFGLTGVEIAQPIADISTCAISLPYVFMFRRMLKKREQEIV